MTVSLFRSLARFILTVFYGHSDTKTDVLLINFYELSVRIIVLVVRTRPSLGCSNHVPSSYGYYFSTYLHYYAKLVTIKIIYSNEFLKQ